MSLLTGPTFTIAASGATSDAVDLGMTILLGLHLPATFTGTTITFTTAPTYDGTYQAAKDSAGDSVSVTVAQGTYCGLSPDQVAALSGCRFIKIVSGSTEGAARSVVAAVRGA